MIRLTALAVQQETTARLDKAAGHYNCMQLKV
jgi:hypothetical protein